jgi:hypothetical protein
MTKKGFHSVLLFFFCLQVYSQSNIDSLAVVFHLEFNKLPLERNKQYVSANKDTLTIEAFKCYISNIQIQFDDTSVFTQNSCHLLDLENPKSLKIPITKRENKLMTKIIFSIGIDSITNNSGALTGDLDPVKGMYWAWQSGYINMKIEGKSPSCTTRKNEFQFHIGGYLQPYYAMRTIELPIRNPKAWGQISNNEIDIAIDLGKFFSEVKVKETNSIMIPGTKAMEIADSSVKLFSVK